MPYDLIPKEVLHNPDLRERLSELDELIEQARMAYVATVAEVEAEEYAAGKQGSKLRTAERLGLSVDKVTNTLRRNPMASIEPIPPRPR